MTEEANPAIDAPKSELGAPAYDSADGRADDPTCRAASEKRPQIELRPLAPEYVPAQHASYVRHLSAAVRRSEVRNIALTGRYGSGKSSILDEFLRQQAKDGRATLHISINTLGPDEGEDITNRIQKELVKQLVYRVGAGEVRRSRFARSKYLTWPRSLRDAAAVAAVLLVLLRLFDVWPSATSLAPVVGAPVIGAVFALAVLAACWIARTLVGDRLVSTVSTGSASVTLEAKPDSYFDEYLDEIMAFFDATEPDVVVFEDLDRFDDARIFDSLRELNTLVNTSALRMGTNAKLLKKKKEQRPLRFVYAIKDSLFEQLGDAGGKVGQNEKPRDTADEAVERANRTKFFEVVVPVVPFLSHGNARDLLVETVSRLELPEGTSIDRRLLDTVGRHATDMRLLLNICNEFVVFAERLLWIDRPAPGITADALFALVAYKNFHLADFEKLPHRGSALDRLETRRHAIIRSGIEGLQRTRREIHHANDLQSEQDGIAQRMGDRLVTARNVSHGTFLYFEVGGQQLRDEEAHSAAFWRQVVDADRLIMVFQVLEQYSGLRNNPIVLDHDQLKVLFPEAMDPAQWRVPDDIQLAARRAQIDRQIACLRGAGFADLVGSTPVAEGGEAFDGVIEKELGSRLARDLVRRGFIDRYYAEYVAAFYGGFLGVDVANFFRNSVWPNEMVVDAKFTTEKAVQNVLDQAPEGFYSSRSALNVEIVDHLLKHDLDRARKVVAFIVVDQGDDARTFIDAFINDMDSLKAGLVAQLAEHPWSGIFDYLATDAMPDEATRTTLLGAALSTATSPDNYDFNESARALIVERHQDLACFTEDQPAERTAVLLAFVRTVGLMVPELLPLADHLRRGVVADGAYALTAVNLRTALGLSDSDPIGLEEVRRDENVRRRCMEDIGTYLEAVGNDDATPHAFRTPGTLRDVVVEQHDSWSGEQLGRLLALSAPGSALPDIGQVPEDTWPAVAAGRVMVLSSANVCAYADRHDVDEALAQLLADQDVGSGPLQDLDAVDETERTRLAVRILNARNYFASAAMAVDVVGHLSLQHGIDPNDLTPSRDGMLARLLEARLVPDAAETFEHFLTAGWPAVAEAFSVSADAVNFLTPGLVSDVLTELLNDSRVPDPIKKKIVENLGAYVPDADQPALRMSSEYARAKQILLPADEVRRIATAAQDDPELVLWQLAQNTELSAHELFAVLPRLGGEYAGFAGGPGHEFEVPVADAMRTVLGRLRGGGLVELRGRASRGRKKVCNLV